MDSLVSLVNDNGVIVLVLFWVLSSISDALPKAGELGAPNDWKYVTFRRALIALTGQIRSAASRNPTEKK